MTDTSTIASDVLTEGHWATPEGTKSPWSDVPVEQLFHLALQALKAEDARLRAAIESRPASRRRLELASRGLGFWVYEHNLVYEVFKAWLPVTDVLWECSVKTDASNYWHGLRAPPARKDVEPGWFDLAIAETEGSELAAVFEFKWWPKSGVARADLKKLEGRTGAKRRFFVGYWTTAAGGLEEDLVGARKELQDQSADWDLCFVGQFATHAFIGRDDRDPNKVFVMAVATLAQ